MTSCTSLWTQPQALGASSGDRRLLHHYWRRFMEEARRRPILFATITVILTWLAYKGTRAMLVEANHRLFPPAFIKNTEFVRVYLGRASIKIPANSDYNVKCSFDGFEAEDFAWHVPAGAPQAQQEAEFQRWWNMVVKSSRMGIRVDDSSQPLLRTFYYDGLSGYPVATAVLVHRGRRIQITRQGPSDASHTRIWSLRQIRADIKDLVARIEEIPASDSWTAESDDFLISTIRIKKVPFTFEQDYRLIARFPGFPGVFRFTSEDDSLNILDFALVRLLGKSEALWSSLMGWNPFSGHLNSRQVAGFPGHELFSERASREKNRDSATPPPEDQGVLDFEWWHRGLHNPLHMRDAYTWQITYESTFDSRLEKIALWNHMLYSMRYYGPIRLKRSAPSS